MRATYMYGAGDVRVEDAPIGFGSMFGPNITLTGGPAPVRAYIETLPPGVLGGYPAMDSRESLKVLVRP